MLTKVAKYMSIGFVIFIIGMFFVSMVMSEQRTVVSIEDASVPVDTEFVVQVMCAPAQPIKGWELSLEYPSDMLEVMQITEGNIFSGYPTFFMNGTVNGDTIEDVYNLIIGQGNVTDQGSLISILFRSKNVVGNAELKLVGVGICNESAYVPVLTSNATITIYGDNPSVEVQSTVSDPIDTFLGWWNVTFTADGFPYTSSSLHVKHPDTGWVQYTFDGYINSSTILKEVGNYSYYVQVSDIYGNHNQSETYTLTVPPNWEVVVDGVINVLDYNQISYVYGETGENGWIREDVDNNGKINIQDIVCSALNHNDTWW